MRYTSTIAAVAVLALLSQTAAAEASREESIGVGSGAVIGGLAGGPVGLIIGAAIGAKVGDTVNRRSERIEDLNDSLADANRAVLTLERGIDDLNSEVTTLQRTSRPELLALMQAGIDMDLLFRTDEFALTDTTGDRLVQLATTLAAMTDVRIQLDGFADERGASDYNHALSEKRVAFVRDLFIASGVQPARISTSAHGEVVAQNPDADSYALERRVSVKLFVDNARTVASNPN